MCIKGLNLRWSMLLLSWLIRLGGTWTGAGVRRSIVAKKTSDDRLNWLLQHILQPYAVAAKTLTRYPNRSIICCRMRGIMSKTFSLACSLEYLSRSSGLAWGKF